VILSWSREIQISIISADGRLKPGRKLIFPPAGGTKGVKVIASILGGRDEQLPIAFFDSDQQGKATLKALGQGLYANDKKSKFRPLLVCRILKQKT
jgi:hypothetical protein